MSRVRALLVVVAVLNGAFRELVAPAPASAPPTSSARPCLSARSSPSRPCSSRGPGRELLVAGGWAALTVGFVVGHVEGTPGEVLLAGYDALAGRVWVLVPLAMFVAPLAFGRSR